MNKEELFILSKQNFNFSDKFNFSIEADEERDNYYEWSAMNDNISLSITFSSYNSLLTIAMVIIENNFHFRTSITKTLSEIKNPKDLLIDKINYLSKEGNNPFQDKIKDL